MIDLRVGAGKIKDELNHYLVPLVRSAQKERMTTWQSERDPLGQDWNSMSKKINNNSSELQSKE